MSFRRNYRTDEPTRVEIDGTTGPLLLEFGAPWCGYCLAVEPILSELLQRFPQVHHIRIHDGPGLPLGRSFRVKLWPNLVFLRDGQLVDQAARPGKGRILEGLQAIAGEPAS